MRRGENSGDTLTLGCRPNQVATQNSGDRRIEMWVQLYDGSEIEVRREFSGVNEVRLLRANLRRHLNSLRAADLRLERILLEAENSANARIAARQ